MNEIFEVLLPGMMYFWVLFIGQGPMQEVLQEKEDHTLARVLAAPVTVSQFVLSKMIRCFLLCLLVQTLLLALSALLFGIRWGNPGLLICVLAVSALSMTGLLAFIYALARTKEQANALSTIVLLTFAMLGGSMMPFESLPKFLQAVGQFTPNRWGILAVQAVARSKPLAELIQPVVILAALGLAGSMAAFFLFRRQCRY